MTVRLGRDRWLVRPRPNPSARLRLLCLPFAGGGASVFRRWPAGLPEWVEVCAVQPPGREDRLRESPHRRVDTLVAEAAVALAPALESPYALFGHSMGAIVAFELARRLRHEGRPEPVCLIVSARVAPQVPSRRRSLHDLPEPEFREELRRLEGTPPAVLEHEELMGLFSPLLRADFAVSDTYVYRDEPPLDASIVALGGEDDPWVSREDLEAWSAQTGSSFESRVLPGGHFFLQTAEPRLLALLSGVLAAGPVG